MTGQLDQHFWTVLGWGTAGAATCIDASGRSGCLILAWKEEMFAVSTTWQGHHIAAAKLVARSHGSHLVAASAYGPTAVMRRAELCEDLRHLCTSFSRSPLIIGGDFNITLAPEDRPHGLGGRDPGSAQLWLLSAHFGLQEMGPADRRFTWRGPTSQSRLDRFLYSIEMLERSPLAEVTSLPRPLSDHTPILWSSQVGMEKPPYFKLDHSWLRDATIKASIEEWWNSQIVFGPASKRVT